MRTHTPTTRRSEEPILLDRLRQSRAATTAPHQNHAALQQQKDMLSRDHDRTRAVEKILRVQRDHFERGAAQSVLEQFWLTGLAITRAWFAERNHVSSADVRAMTPAARRARLLELHEAEAIAQGAREVAEVGLYEGSDAAVARFIEAQTAYSVADQALADFARAVDLANRAPMSVRVVRRSTASTAR